MIVKQVFSGVNLPLLCGLLLLHGCGGGGGSSGSKPPASSAGASSVAPLPSSVAVTSVATTSASSADASSVVPLPSSVAVTSISTTSASVANTSTPVSITSSSASTTSESRSSSSSSVISQSLALNGWVGSADLIGGEIVFTAGTQSFTAAINAEQKYQVNLELEAKNKSLPITAIARATANSNWVEFANLLPSADTLGALAGGDNVLGENEFPALNITALTTAEFAEIKNNNMSLTNDTERKRALASLHPVRAIEQAAMITRLLPNSSAVLPAQTTTTLNYLLDARVAETYLEALRATDRTELKKQISAVQEDIFKASTTELTGNFSLEGQYSNFFMTFNANGTGSLRADSINTDILVGGDAPKVNANFTWSRDKSTVNINFTDVVSYKVSSIRDAGGQLHNCDISGTSQVELCDLVFNAIQLDLLAESDVRFIGAIKLDVRTTKESDSNLVYQGAIESQAVRVIKLDSASDIKATELSSTEWVSKNYSFTFSTDGKAVQKNLLTKTSQTVDWSLIGNQLQIGNLNIWFGARNEAGFSVFWVHNDAVIRDALIKRTSVTMTETDWVGRWSFYPGDLASNSYDVNADKTWRDGFEAKSQGSWALIDNHRQTALANASWRMERDVVAIHNGKYYLSVCQGVEVTSFSPSDCYLSIESKSADYSSATFWNNWSHPVFNNKNSGGIWLTLYGHVIYSSDATSSLSGDVFYKVSENILFYPKDKRIVEMTSASQDEIELCEYYINDSCNDANKRRYTTGVEVKLTRSGGGVANYPYTFFSFYYNSDATFALEVDKVFMAPKNRPFILRMAPNIGATLSSVSGCGGVIVGNEYRIPALIENCEIIVNFQ